MIPTETQPQTRPLTLTYTNEHTRKDVWICSVQMPCMTEAHAESEPDPDLARRLGEMQYNTVSSKSSHRGGVDSLICSGHAKLTLMLVICPRHG